MIGDREVIYCATPGGRVAVARIGSGSPALVVVPGLLSHVDALWNDPSFSRWAALLATQRRVITYDPAGLGASSTLAPGEKVDATLELTALLDALGDEVVLFGWFSGAGPVEAASGHPAVRSAMVYAPYSEAPTLPWDEWGTGAVASALCPSRRMEPIWGRLERATAVPAARSVVRARVEAGCTSGKLDSLLPTRCSLEIASSERATTFIDTADAIPWGDAASDVARHLFNFSGDEALPTQRRRALVAVMVSDIVNSTTVATSVGGMLWKQRLETHDVVVAARVTAHGGFVGRHTGDGAVATFPLVSDAVKCAAEVAEEARRVGLPARVGVHVGEVELEGDTPSGLTVRIANRITGLAGANEVIVSGTARAAVAGGRFAFERRGLCEFEGWGEVETYALQPPAE